MRAGRRPRTALRHLVPGVAVALALAAAPSPAVAEDHPPVPDLTLVTLTGAGTAASGHRSGTPADRAAMLARQDALLSLVGADQPVYRWTTALNGFAVHLDEAQATTLQQHPLVASVEANRVWRLAGRSAATLGADMPRTRGGAGVVVGFVDSGIDPDSPVFAAVPGLGADPRDWSGVCSSGEDWGPDTCNRKVVGAGWFVAGFGAERLRASEVLSARDVLGHGTQTASVAAGNAGVSVRIDDRAAGRFGGVAPQARVAAYKACWAAPDPADDGCSTADLVSAVDRATADGVDVLNLAVADDAAAPGVDTVERALLGAAEADVVVVAAAGNASRSSFASWQAPWVTTVGGLAGRLPEAAVAAPGGPRLLGAGRGSAVRGRLLLAGAAAAPGATLRDARQCRPGSLDARQVAGRIVVCERGGLGRVDKSAAVERADGAGMVLVNARAGGLTADFHSVPTVHLSQRDGQVLRRWAVRHPDTPVRLVPVAAAAGQRRTARWSPPGDPRGLVLKPDVVAVGEGVLGSVPASRGQAWALFSGTSAASARASGLAALLRGRHDWSASVVRSVLTTTAAPVGGSSVLHQGAGTLQRDVPTTHLALDVASGAWRRALEQHDWAGLNTSSLLLRGAGSAAVRRVTNIGPRAEYFSVTAEGFSRGRVRVTPAAVRLAPGESHAFRVTVTARPGPAGLDDGWVVWRGARGGVTRIPVALTR